MDRREFTKATLLALASGALGVSCTTAVPQKSQYTSSSRGSALLCLGKGKTSILRELNLDTFEYKDTELPIAAPHAVTRVGNEIFAFGIFGSAAKVAADGKVTIVDHMKGEGFFLGHGLVSMEDEILWATEMKIPGKGIVRARSTKDMKIIDGHGYEFRGGHHIVKLPGTDLIATCGSEDESHHHVTFYDLKKRKVVNTFACRYPGIHLLPVSESEVVIATTEFLLRKEDGRNFERMSDPKARATMTEKERQFAGFSPVIYANIHGETKELWSLEEKDHFQHGFGLDKAGSGRFLSSHFSSDSVILWKDNEIERIYQIPCPLVVIATDDGKSLIAQSEGKIVMHSLETGLLEKELKFALPVASLSRY